MALIEAKIVLSYYLLNYKVKLDENFKLKMNFKFIYGPENDKFLLVEKL
jgi:hypothetical protein